MGASGMQEAFAWSKDKVDSFLLEYNSALPYVAETMKKVSDVSAKRGYITTIGGRRARLRSKETTYTMLNRLNQGGSAEIMKSAMVEAAEQGLTDILTMHITVHDELVCSVPKTVEGLEAVKKLQHIMENTTKLSIPLLADPELGKDWYNVEEFNEEELRKEIKCKAKRNSKRK